ncbi:MAG: GAF domain-containing protein [Verrucomicrobiota bacterium]
MSTDESIRPDPVARLEALLRVSESVHASLELRDSLERILGEAVRLVGGDAGLLALMSPMGFLEIEASTGLPVGVRSIRLRIGEGLAGRVARTGIPGLVEDVSHQPSYLRFHPDVACEVAVPLRVSGEVRGVLAIQSFRPRAFDRGTLSLLEDLSTLAGMAIRNTWLYEKARLKARSHESLVRVGQIINSALSLDEALEVVTREATSLLRAKMCSLLMLDPTGQWLDLRASHGAGERYRQKPRLAVDESFAGIVVRRGRPMQLEDVQVSGRYQNVSVAREEKLVSLLSVPLAYAGKVIGVLNLYTGEPHTFSDEEVRVLSAYAELSALALERARLYERTLVVEEQLRESERLTALGLLAAELAHEIRNPLTVMKMLHHSVSADFAGDDPRSTDLRVMGEKIDHLNRIVDRVLDLARRHEPVLALTNLNRLLEDLGILIHHKCRVQGVEQDTRLDPRIPGFQGDATQLEQAFLNVILNSLEAMPEGGRLRIRTRWLPSRDPSGAPDTVVIRLSDTGSGMPREQRERAFSSLLSTTKPKGTGIGLAVVARVVETHEGRVRIWSRPGRGTSVGMFLPIRL